MKLVLSYFCIKQNRTLGKSGYLHSYPFIYMFHIYYFLVIHHLLNCQPCSLNFTPHCIKCMLALSATVFVVFIKKGKSAHNVTYAELNIRTYLWIPLYKFIWLVHLDLDHAYRIRNTRILNPIPICSGPRISI